MSEADAARHAPPLPPGNRAPDFELLATPDQKVMLSDFRGQPVILVFYPEDWSPVCSDQLGLYQAVLPEFQKFGAELIAISVSKDSMERSGTRGSVGEAQGLREPHAVMLSPFGDSAIAPCATQHRTARQRADSC